MWSSMVPTDYFGFYCTPRLQAIYISLVRVLHLKAGITVPKAGLTSIAN